MKRFCTFVWNAVIGYVLTFGLILAINTAWRGSYKTISAVCIILIILGIVSNLHYAPRTVKRIKIPISYELVRILLTVSFICLIILQSFLFDAVPVVALGEEVSYADVLFQSLPNGIGVDITYQAALSVGENAMAENIALYYNDRVIFINTCHALIVCISLLAGCKSILWFEWRHR